MENRVFRTPLPPIDEILSIFDVNLEEGKLIFNPRPREQFKSDRLWLSWNRRFSGAEAGYLNTLGYRVIRTGSLRFLAHRAVWKVATGDEPEELDHIDRNPSNNALANLRAATRSENNRNKHLSKYNTSGFLGVYRSPKGYWVAQYKLMGKGHHLGLFDTIDEAIAARSGAEKAFAIMAGTNRG